MDNWLKNKTLNKTIETPDILIIKHMIKRFLICICLHQYTIHPFTKSKKTKTKNILNISTMTKTVLSQLISNAQCPNA